MNYLSFIFLSFLWLADMAAMVALGHLSHHLIVFSMLYCFAFILLIALVRRFPEHLSSYQAFLIVLTLGFTGRVLFLFYPAGNDIYRYVWEGQIQNLGFNPYMLAPNDPALSGIAHGKLYPIWQHINHKAFSAVYPPLTLLMFRLMVWLNPNPMLFKIILVLFDMGLMIVLGLLIKLKQLPVKRLLLYACNPLVIIFIAGEGHLDGLQVFFLFLGLFFLVSHKKIVGFLCLGLAAVSKYLAAVAIPYFVSYRSRVKWLVVFLPLALFIPYLDAGKELISSVVSFGAGMHYNDSLFAVLRLLFGGTAHLLGVILLLMCFIWIFLFVHDRLRSVYLALCCLIVFLPTLHPWYLILIAPFMVFFPSKAWMYLQAAVVFTFPVIAFDHKTGIFQELHWLKLLEYGPFYVLLALGIFRKGLFENDRLYSAPQNISVIIPTLNEAGSISQCLMSLKNRTAMKEVIIADGGSIDKTREIAANHGARVVESQKGRGVQISTGVAAAEGDAMLILHADCFIKKGLLSRILNALRANPQAAGGACGMQFENQHAKMRIVACMNNIRALFTDISFGDQAQFFRREAFSQIDGFPVMMLMEDVELSLRLKQIGRVLFLRNGVLASGRRWKDKSFSRNFFKVIRLFVRYLIERRLGKVKATDQQYYNDYYG